MQNHQRFYRIFLLLTLAIAACEQDETILNAVVCEDLSVEIEFIVPDSFLTVTILNGTAPYSYQWSDGSTRSTLSPPERGLNSVTVTDANGCTAEAQLEAQTGCSIFVRKDFREGTDPGTFVFSVEAFGDAPPFEYNWSATHTDNTVLITEAGRYAVSVSDANGCLIGTGVTLNDGPNGLCELRVRIEQEADGRLRAFASRGGANRTYLWSDGSTEQEVLNPLPATLYSVTVTTGDGCPSSAEIQL